MPRTAEPIIHKVPEDRLNGLLSEMIDQLDTPAKAIKAEKRLTLVRMRYLGVPLEDCAKYLGLTLRTCYNIQNDWNERGEESLVPKTSSGAKPKLSEEKIEEIKAAIKDRSMTVKETADFIREDTGTTLSENQIRRIFQNEVKMLRRRS